MSIKALIRRWTGRGGAISRATCTRDVCRLSALAMAAQVSVGSPQKTENKAR